MLVADMSGESDLALWALMQAIGKRNSHAAMQLLDATPSLAREALRVGATRQEASTYFFDDIAHGVFAGDTALHVAAAAYDGVVAKRLLADGAHVGAQNRRGAGPLHYACDGIPGASAWNPDAQNAMVG